MNPSLLLALLLTLPAAVPHGGEVVQVRGISHVRAASGALISIE